MSSDSDETTRLPGAPVNSDPPESEDIIEQLETAQRVYDDMRAAFRAWSDEHARTTSRATWIQARRDARRKKGGMHLLG